MKELVQVSARLPDHPAARVSRSFPGEYSDAPRSALPAIGQILRRRWKRILAVSVLLLVLAGLALIIVKPRYSAEAMLSLDVQRTQLADFQAAQPHQQIDGGFIRSEIEVLRSPALAIAVINALRLTDDPEFAASPSRLEAIIERVAALLRPDSAPDTGVSTDQASDGYRKLEAALIKVASQLRVTNNGQSYIVHIAFSSVRPKTASAVANKFAELYLARQREAKDAQLQRASAWYEQRLAELTTKVADAENAAAFRSREGLLESGGRPVVEHELTDTTLQLVLANTDITQKQAALQQQRAGGALATELNDLLLQHLREREAQLVQDGARLLTTLGRSHPTVAMKQNEIAENRSKIASEVKRVNSNMAAEVAIAQSRQQALRDRVAQLKATIDAADHARVRQRDLDADAQNERAIYESFLVRYRQTIGEQAVQQPDAQLVSDALMPTTRSSPSVDMFVAIAVAVGAAIGLAWAVLLEQLDTTLRRSVDIERITHLPVLGPIPVARLRRKGAAGWADRAGTDYWGGVMNVRTALSLGNRGRLPDTVLVTSAMPGEGKSTFAMSLARSVAQTGLRALVVECDLRHPSIARTLGNQASGPGLADILSGSVLSESVIIRDEATGVHVIPAGRQVADPQSMLGSDRMRALLHLMKGDYDFIVMDSPPIMAGPDALLLSTMAETTALVVRWGQSRRTALASAVRVLWEHGGDIAGVVLTCVDVRRHRQYTRDDYGLIYAIERRAL